MCVCLLKGDIVCAPSSIEDSVVRCLVATIRFNSPDSDVYVHILVRTRILYSELMMIHSAVHQWDETFSEKACLFSRCHENVKGKNLVDKKGILTQGQEIYVYSIIARLLQKSFIPIAHQYRRRTTTSDAGIIHMNGGAYDY